ncbi:MAG: isocitrate lyase/PEP mutase family protein [Acidimicrobiales bacterium]
MSQPSEAFASLHRAGEPLFLPNAWDFASGAVLAQAGYEAIGTTSLGVAAAAGKPDAAGRTRAETVAVATRLARLPVLLTVDVESGFSDDPEQVADVAEQLFAVGAVGINLEDGRPDGTLSSIAHHCAKIAAVKSRVPDLFVNARTDVFWLGSDSTSRPISEALGRGRAYVAAGADGFYVPGVAGAQVTEVSHGVDAPLNVLYLPGRDTFSELAALGAGRVSTGSLLVRSTLQTVIEMANEARHGAVPVDPDRPTYHQVQDLLGEHE